MTHVSHEAFAAFVGIDWADAKHDVCLQPAGSATCECFQLEHTPEAIDAWVTTLRTRFNGQPVAICLELNKGPIVSALRKYDFLVLFPLNPLTLARYREAFTPSRAKDDPTDAALQLELLLTHRDKLQPLQPQSPTMRALAQLVEHRRRVVGDKVRITNRLTSTLKNYFPHVLHWFQEKDTAIFCDFLSRWPTLKAVQLARRSTLDAFGEQRERYASAAELQKYAGIAPVTERSGKKSWVHWRLQCPKFLRQTCVEWAAESTRHSFWAQVYYQQQREKGKAHQAAVRALAFKWIRILSRCWQERTPYDESIYLQALKRRNAPLLHNLAKES